MLARFAPIFAPKFHPINCARQSLSGLLSLWTTADPRVCALRVESLQIWAIRNSYGRHPGRGPQHHWIHSPLLKIVLALMKYYMLYFCRSVVGYPDLLDLLGFFPISLCSDMPQCVVVTIYQCWGLNERRPHIHGYHSKLYKNTCIIYKNYAVHFFVG